MMLATTASTRKKQTWEFKDLFSKNDLRKNSLSKK